MTQPLNRRTILKGAAAIGALAITPTCRRTNDSKGEIRPAPGTLRDHLRALLLVIGPWTVDRAAEADSMIARYLSEDRLKKFGATAPAFALLATRFSKQAAAADSLDLTGLPTGERTAIIALATDLYGVTQVRFAVAGIPDPGQCVGDPSWHTIAPAEIK